MHPGTFLDPTKGEALVSQLTAEAGDPSDLYRLENRGKYVVIACYEHITDELDEDGNPLPPREFFLGYI